MKKKKKEISHPYTRMCLDLVSVDLGWLRRFQCPTCGNVYLGRIGKTLSTMRTVKWCDGITATSKMPPPFDDNRRNG